MPADRAHATSREPLAFLVGVDSRHSRSKLMCGICGSVSIQGEPVDAADVAPMLRAMVHRGPDAEGLLLGDGIAAGIRRLAVIDVEGGDQPIANEDGTVRVVFNGEIYNHRELREELIARGHTFRTRADTEVLVHLWEDLGPDLLRRLNGMFAFCIHDRRTREVFLARDPLGIKPLFYRLAGDLFVFASEIAALLRHRSVPAEIDQSRLAELYCLQYLTGGATVYRDVQKLPPGHAIRIRDGRMEVTRWHSPPAGDRRPRPAVDAAGELRELIESAVDLQRIADVPLGVFLSGGIDSTIVASVLAKKAGRRIETFSVGFEGEPGFDERRFAALAARHIGSEHHELLVSAESVALELPRLVRRLAEPVLDPAMIPTLVLSEFARRRVTVVLTGEGADELFGGYRRYLYEHRFGALASLPGVARLARLASRLPLSGRAPQALEALAERDPATSHVRWSFTVATRVAAGLFGPRVVAGTLERIADTVRPHFAGVTALDGSLRADLAEWLPHNLLAKVDRASMAHSLEARVPFLDHRIVEWAAALPGELRIRGGSGKWILREAFRDSLPAELLERPKQGFDLPLASWLRGPLRPLVTDLFTPDGLARWEGLDAGYARGMMGAHLRGERDFGLPLFNLLSILLFLGADR